MKNIDIQPELLDIDRMKSKPYSKKEALVISAFIKIGLSEDINFAK